MTVDLSTLPLFSPLLDFTYAGLMALTTFLSPATGPFTAALAVVLVTLVVRAGLIPAGIAQAKADRARARLAPRLRELQRRHRDHPERLQRETMKLYRAEGASPLAGCLPILVQAPIVGLLYSVFLHSTIGGHPNELLTQTLFGVPLGTSLSGAVSAGSVDLATSVVIGCVVASIAVIGELTRRMFRMMPLDTTGRAGSSRLVAVLVGLSSFATAAVALFVPVAAGLYLLTTVTWTLVQRLILRRVYPAEST